LWGEQEYDFFKKFNSLQNEKSLNIVKFEEIVDEIKACVTKHLSEIAVNDLVKQLKLIKDIYLLGRGELFLEFIKQTKNISNKMINDGTARGNNTVLNVQMFQY
jgi:gamma-tubulin complex component 4